MPSIVFLLTEQEQPQAGFRLKLPWILTLDSAMLGYDREEHEIRDKITKHDPKFSSALISVCEG